MSWPASGCRRWAGCWPARATRPPDPCWSGPGTAARTNSVQAIALAGIARVESALLAGDDRAAVELARVPLSAPRSGGPSATGASCSATWPAAGTRWRCRRAARRSSPSASRATGPARPSCGGRSAPPTSTPWSWPPRAASRSCWRRWRRSTASGPWSPPTWSGAAAHGRHPSPRRPRPRTRANPAGLTDRQLEVLQLLAEGLTNAEIADRLVVSVRAVDHHVAAILAKLNVGSRWEAARAAADLGA